tara:strand:+ start:834 stop:1079 length:246 start_codon:yes stop_codon:yes gene_type:complete
MEEEHIRTKLKALLAEWLDSPIGLTSADRAVNVSASQKLSTASPVFTQEETDAIIDCMMETVNIESKFADEVIDYLNLNTV